MICVSKLHMAKFRSKLRPAATKHISFDSSRRVNQNPSSAHRLVEFSTRYRRFRLRMRSNCSYCACADKNADISKRSQPIYAQLIDSDSTRRDESNDMCFEAACAQIASAKHVHAPKHISFDSSRRAEQESVKCA